MKRLVLMIGIAVLGSLAVAQDIKIYDIKGEGSVTPSWNISQADNGTRIDLDLEGFSSRQETLNGVAAERIILADGIGLMEKGLPDIQHLSVSIAIPSTGKHVLVPIAGDYTDYPSFNIAPSSGDPSLDQSNASYIDTSIYNQNAFWPVNTVAAGDPYILADVRGLSVHFFPIQYNPVTHTLRVYHHISVQIKTTGDTGFNEITRTSHAPSAVMQSIVADQFLNAYDYIANSGRYMAVAEEGNMLIISHPDFIDAIKPFASWKVQKGIHCDIVDVTTIGDASKIRDYVKEYYYTNGLTYLVLIGDAKYVPSNQATKGASDNMYGYIAGDDHYPEVLTGRFSCETAEQCRLMVEKTISYEKNPSAKADFDNLLGIGSGLGPGDDGELDYEHIRKIGAVTGTVYNDFTELYDGSRGGNDLNGNPTAAMAADAINEGQGSVMYLGHGSINSWLTTGFSTKNALELENTETFPFIWSAGCDNGGFTETTCLAEAFMRAQHDGKPSGAVAAFMSSANQSWYPPMEAQDEIALFLAGRKQINGPATFGGISISGCMRMNDKYNQGAFTITDNWILFGDPSLEIRNAKPVKFHPVHDTLVGSDALSFTVSALDSGSYVCITSNGTILSSLRTVNDECLLSLPPLAGYEKLTITITGKNRIPYIGEVQITNLPAVAVNPNPGNNTFKISVDQEFSWNYTGGCNPASADFYIRKAGANSWDSYSVTGATSIRVPVLEYMTDYEWQVITTNNSGTSESSVFTLQTIDRPDEDFEQEGFPRSHWMNDHEWFVDNTEAWEGNYSLHSGSTASRGTSSLFFDCETLSCDYISFMVKLNVQDPGVGISFYIDDFMVAEWDYTMNWTNITYQVEPGHHMLEWRFTGSDSISNGSAAWLDNIYLPVNEALQIGAMAQEICPVTAVQLQAEVSNYASLKWETTGTGHFDDPSKPDAIYYPTEEDHQLPSILLNLVISTNRVCADEVYSYELIKAGLPVFAELNDTTIYLEESFTVPVAEGSVNQYLLLGTETTPLTLEETNNKLAAGSNIITVVAENTLGCSVTKQFTVNVINTARPEDHSLTVYPNPTADRIILTDPSISDITNANSIISIYSTEGLLVEQLELESVNGTTIQVDHLNPGLYIIRSEKNGNISTGRFIKI